MQPLPRRTKLVLLISVVFFVILFSLYHSNTPQEQRYQWKRPTAGGFNGTSVQSESLRATTTKQALPTPTTLCQGDECFKGRWRPRQKPYTSLEELKPWKGCPNPPPVAAVGWDQEEADEKRLLDIMNYAWTPDAGRMRDWNAEAFVVRLLRSPGGLIIVGGEYWLPPVPIGEANSCRRNVGSVL